MKLHVFFRDLMAYEDGYLFSASNMNGLYYYNKNDGSLKYLLSFDKESEKNFLHIQVIKYENKAIFIPFNAQNIAVWEIGANYINYIKVPNSDLFVSSKFSGGVINDKKLILCPCRYDKVLILDLETYSIDLIELNLALLGSEEQPRCFSAFFCRGVDLFIGSYQNNKIIKYNLSDNTTNVIELSDGVNGIIYMDQNNDEILVVGRYGEISLYNLRGNLIYKSLEAYKYGIQQVFYNCALVGGELYLSVTDRHCVMKFNINDKSICSIDIPRLCNARTTTLWAEFFTLKSDGSGGILCLDSYGSYLHKIVEEKVIRSYCFSLTIDKNNILQYLNLTEDEMLTLDEWLECL